MIHRTKHTRVLLQAFYNPKTMFLGGELWRSEPKAKQKEIKKGKTDQIYIAASNLQGGFCRGQDPTSFCFFFYSFCKVQLRKSFSKVKAERREGMLVFFVSARMFKV